MLIDRDQTGYVKNRFIGENILLISDVIESYEGKNLPGMLLFIDFEKAFDSLEWSFLFKVLEVMNFGPMFRKWIQTFYSNSNSTEAFDKVVLCRGFFFLGVIKIYHLLNERGNFLSRLDFQRKYGLSVNL